MSLLIGLFKILIPFAYLMTTGLYGLAFFKSNQGIARFKTVLLIVSIFFNLCFLTLLTTEYKHPPLTSVYEVFLLLGLTVASAYFFIELITKIKNTGFFIVLISTLFVVIAVVFLDMNYGFQDEFRSAYISLHVVFALVGYSAFTISASYGLLFLILYKKIKVRKFDIIYKNIPNLEVLELMIKKAVVVGFIALTISIIIGVVWLPIIFPGTSFFDVKLLYTLLVWFTYGIGIFAGKLLGLHGRKIALSSILVLVVLFMLMALTNYFSGFHNFN